MSLQELPTRARSAAQPFAIPRAQTHTAASDNAFDSMQSRGQVAKGVDQYTSIHTFDAVATGGRIDLQRDNDDAKGVATIRSHIRRIAKAFKSGDFPTLAFVLMKGIPPRPADAWPPGGIRGLWWRVEDHRARLQPHPRSTAGQYYTGVLLRGAHLP